MHFSLIFSTLLLSAISAEHVTVTYHFWEKNPEVVEKVEWFTRYVANSNRFWTSNLVYLQQNEQNNKIQISSESWKSANIEETITDLDHLDEFFVSIFQKFAGKLYTNKALDSLPVFDDTVFERSRHAYEGLEINAKSLETFRFDYWLKISDDFGTSHASKYVFSLLIRKRTFEQWEAVVNFVSAIKRSGQPGYIIDCEKENKICPDNSDDDTPILYAFRDEEIQAIYEGGFQKNHVHDWILTIKQPQIRILNENLVPQYRSGNVPGFDRPRHTVTILFVHTKKCQVWRNYVKFAKENHGKFHLTAVVSPEVKKWSFHPAFITMKPDDPYVKAFTLYKDIHWNRMVEFLEDGVHPGCHPLISPSEFLFATSVEKPLLVFFDPLGTKNVTGFQYHASQEQTSERSAFYAAISGMDLFGLYIMSVFNIDTPSYVVIRRDEKGWCLFKKPIENDNFLSVKAWVQHLEPSHCDDFIEDFMFPIARLNLLERYEDVDELEQELTAVERNRDEL